MAEWVTVYLLEMRSQLSLKPKTDSKGLSICECEIEQPKFNCFLYELVGADWQWTDRLSWTAEQWKDHVGQRNLRTEVAYKKGAIADYYA